VSSDLASKEDYESEPTRKRPWVRRVLIGCGATLIMVCGGCFLLTQLLMGGMLDSLLRFGEPLTSGWTNSADFMDAVAVGDRTTAAQFVSGGIDRLPSELWTISRVERRTEAFFGFDANGDGYAVYRVRLEDGSRADVRLEMDYRYGDDSGWFITNVTLNPPN
jgi:hypothetical protein